MSTANCLQDDKLPLALVADLQEGLAGHVLDTRVHLVHELEQLVHHCLQELPVVPQKPRILPNHIPAVIRSGLSNTDMLAQDLFGAAAAAVLCEEPLRITK